MSEGEFSRWSRDDFFRAAIRPEFPNAMKFVLDIPEEKRLPDAAFSMEGFDSLMENIKSFVMARTLGVWNGTGVPPHELTVELNLEFKAESRRALAGGPYPWWVLTDDGKTMIDGNLRTIAERGEP